MNRRGLLEIAGVAAVVPAALPASESRVVRLWEFYSGSGDEEVVAAYTKQEAIDFMRSLVCPEHLTGNQKLDDFYARKYAEGFRPENVHEIGGQSLMHDVDAATDDEPHGPLVPMSSVLQKSLAGGSSVPLVLAAMNW